MAKNATERYGAPVPCAAVTRHPQPELPPEACDPPSSSGLVLEELELTPLEPLAPLELAPELLAPPELPPELPEVAPLALAS
jgi:hypothetical protein